MASTTLPHSYPSRTVVPYHVDTTLNQNQPKMSTTGEKGLHLLITISTTSSKFSLSDDEPFTITLAAESSSNSTLSIDAFRTLLSTDLIALDYQGLTFRDLETGDFAKRRVIDVQDRIPDQLTATSPDIVEIPPLDANDGRMFEVVHTFKRAPTADPVAELPTSDVSRMTDFDKAVYRAAFNSVNQTEGFLPGYAYIIALGRGMSSVSWWREGTKAEIFLMGPMSRYAKPLEKLEMELVRTTKFEVVE